MKKIISLILIIACIALTACGNETEDTNSSYVNSQEEVSNYSSNEIETSDVSDSNSHEDISEDEGEKIEGEIIAASDFSEGLAFVELSNDKGRTYCIDKKGNIVFRLDIKLSAMGYIYATFINGLAYVNVGLCDKTGKVTRPEDVGATNFIYVSTLRAGYILAEVIESDYSSTTKKLGVLNTKFEWTVEPTENLYNEFSNKYGSLAISTASITSDYTVGDLFYCSDLNKILNLKTGEVINDKEKIGEIDSSLWVLGANFTQYTGYYLPGEGSDLSEDRLVLDLTKNGVVCSATNFVDGKAAIVYHNASANKYYVTMIDDQGKHLFEPVETKYKSVENDGKYILVTEDRCAEAFDDSGEKLGKIDFSTDLNKSYSFYFNDGIVLLRAGSGYNYTCYYYNVDFTPLF